MKSATPLRHSTAYLVSASLRARARSRRKFVFFPISFRLWLTSSVPLVPLLPLPPLLSFRAPFTPPNYVSPSSSPPSPPPPPPLPPSSSSSSSRFLPVAALHRALSHPHCLHVHCHAAPHTRVDTARRIAKTHVSSSSFAASSSCRRFRCDLCRKDEVMGNLRVNRRREKVDMTTINVVATRRKNARDSRARARARARAKLRLKAAIATRLIRKAEKYFLFRYFLYSPKIFRVFDICF